MIALLCEPFWVVNFMIKLPDFIIIPYPLLEDKEISLIDERLYGIIYWLTKLKNEKCTASNDVLAQLVKTTPRSIQNSLITLEKKGFIKRHFKDKESKYRTQIEVLITYERPFVPYAPPFVGVRTAVRRGVRTMGDQNKNNVYKKKNKEELAPEAPSTDQVEVTEEITKMVSSSLSGDQWGTLINPFEKMNPMFKKIFANNTERNALTEMVQNFGFDKTSEYISLASRYFGVPYGPLITKPTELLRNLGKLLAFHKQQLELQNKKTLLANKGPVGNGVGKYSGLVKNK